MRIASPSSHPSEADVRPGTAASLYAVFSRSRQLFGLGIDLVREVLPGQPLTRVPRARGQVLGVLNLRGEILPVVTIDAWLGLPQAADDSTRPIIVLRRAELLVGLRVDAIKSVQSIPSHQIQPHPAAAAEGHLKGIWHPEGQTPIALIDGAALLGELCQQTATPPI